MAAQINSAVTIAKLLGTQGYNDYVHNLVERWWKRNIIKERYKHRVQRIEDAMSELMADMSEADRLVIGRFISLRSKMGLDAGMRIGMQAFAHVSGKNIQPEEHESDSKTCLRISRSLTKNTN